MNYYNDNDKFAANWLRCLISEELIPEGVVDERPIQEVEAKDLEGFIQCHFFCGIAGWPLALQIAGWPTDEPVWSGSCPCQPLSVAGKQQGEKDERHLWPEFYRLISECRPVRVFGEQSESPDGLEWLDGISLDLEEIGYAVGSIDLPSACIGAPNKRQRAWWVAHSDRRGGNRRGYEGPGESLQEGGGSPFERSAGFCSYGRLANTDRSGQERGQLDGQAAPGCDRIGREHTDDKPAVEIIRADGGLGNTKLQRSKGPHSKKLPECGGRSKIRPAGPWDQFRIIQCRDGKSRRIPVEREFQLMVAGLRDRVDVGWIEKLYEKDPGGVENFMSMFPLNKRIPGRVGFLRGAGNAINPWVAAEFIRAYMDYLGVK